ncbi:MAG: hypothetical protein N4A41_11055 [Crocinitomicaceae bacterium]|jgi:hypothetical protein|nr:hypothetical protein [Crocinitomicaceae bacterium]
MKKTPFIASLLLSVLLLISCNKLGQKRIKPFDIHLYHPENKQPIIGAELIISEFNQPDVELETIGDPFFIGTSDAEGKIFVDKKLKTKELGFIIENRSKQYTFVGKSAQSRTRILNKKKTENLLELQMVPTGSVNLQIQHVCDGSGQDKATLSALCTNYYHSDFSDYETSACGSTNHEFTGIAEGDHELYVRYERDGNYNQQTIKFSVKAGETTNVLVNY